MTDTKGATQTRFPKLSDSDLDLFAEFIFGTEESGNARLNKLCERITNWARREQDRREKSR